MVQTLRPLALAPLRRALGYRMDLAMRGLPIKGEEDPDRVRLESRRATGMIAIDVKQWSQSSCTPLYTSGAKPKSVHQPVVELKLSSSEATSRRSIESSAEGSQESTPSCIIGHAGCTLVVKIRWCTCCWTRHDTTALEFTHSTFGNLPTISAGNITFFVSRHNVRQGKRVGKLCVQETPLVEVPLDAADTAAMESFLSTFDGAASTRMLSLRAETLFF